MHTRNGGFYSYARAPIEELLHQGSKAIIYDVIIEGPTDEVYQLVSRARHPKDGNWTKLDQYGFIPIFPLARGRLMMNKRTYRFAVGIVLVILSLAFFIMPSLLNLDYFIPIMFALVSFILGIWFFFMGNSEK